MAEEQEKGYELICDMGTGLYFAKVRLDKVKEQNINARIMKDDMQDLLTANIKSRGQLESAPLLALVGDTIEIISGHHRIRSARAAGLKEIYAILDTSGLNRSKIATKQLAHNAISGFDDESTLREICKMITDVDDMIESGMGKDYFQKIEEAVESLATPSVTFDFKTVSFTFLPHQLQDMKKLTDSLHTDYIGVADIGQFDGFVDALKKTQKFEDVKAVGAAVYVMVKYANEYIAEATGDDEGVSDWVPISKLFGGGAVPKEAAETITEAIKKADKDGITTSRTKWKLIESLCASYIGKTDE